jgi:hypothetical protein
MTWHTNTTGRPTDRPTGKLVRWNHMAWKVDAYHSGSNEVTLIRFFDDEAGGYGLRRVPVEQIEYVE